MHLQARVLLDTSTRPRIFPTAKKKNRRGKILRFHSEVVEERIHTTKRRLVVHNSSNGNAAQCRATQHEPVTSLFFSL